MSDIYQELAAEKDTKVRTRTLAKLEQNKAVILQHNSEKCGRIINLRHYTKRIEDKDCSQMKQV